MKNRRVVVTGIGAITPIGNNLNEFWSSLTEGKSGAAPITLFDATNFKTKFACEVKGFVATNAGIVEIQRVGTDTQITPWQSLSRPDQLGLVFISHTAENLALLGWAD